MKKRALAVILALCISSGNMMSAFAMASENGASVQVATEEESPAEETNSGENEIEEPGNAEVPADINEDSSSGDDGNSGSVDEEEAVIPADGEGNDAVIPAVSEDDGANGSGDSSQGVSVEDGGDLSEGDGNSMQPDPAVNNDAQGDETSQEGSSISDVQMEPAGDNTLTEEQGGETAAEVAVEKITLDKTSATMSVGEQLQLNAVIQPADATNKKVNWSSSKESIVTVNENGLITAVSGGCANVRAVTEDGQKAFCVVTVVANEGPCGENLTWSLSGTDSNMVLTISGSGEMTDYDSVLDAPWYGNSQNIKEIQLSPDVTYIGKHAFANCKALESITVPDGVESIGDWAFANCSALKDVYLSDGISTIGSYAFSDCRSLRTIDLPETLTDLGERAFSNAGLNSITLPKGITEIKGGTFNQCSRLSSVNLSSETKVIGGDAFFNCSSLRFLELPEGITTIKGGAFYGTGIDELTIPTTITELSSGIFGYSGGGNRVKLFFYGTEEEWKSKQLEYYANNVTFMTSFVESVSIEEDEILLMPDESKTIYANIYPESASCKEVSWVNGGRNYFDGSKLYDGGYRLTGTRKGSGIITVITKDGEKTATATVYVDDKATGIKLNKNALELPVNSEATLNAEVLPSDLIYKKVIWESSDESVASVKDGIITAHNGGSCTITATSVNGGFKDTCEVNVIVPVEGISVNETAVVAQGQSIELGAEVFPENATNKKVLWQCEESDIISLDQLEDGQCRITGLKPGNAELCAITEDGGKTSVCSITVDEKATGIELDANELKLLINEEANLHAEVYPDTLTDKSVTWESSDNEIVSVDNNGKIVAKSGGKAVITAVSVNGNLKDSCVVDVVVPVTGIQQKDDHVVINIGEERQLEAAFEPDNATNQMVTWSSSDSEIVSVDESGLIRANNEGTAKIIATSDDGGFITECEVTVVIPVEAVHLDEKEMQLTVGETARMRATVLPESATNKDISWTTSDESVVSVDEDGNVNALSAGTAVITAVSVDGDKSDSCIVTVPVSVSGVEMESDSVTVDINSETILKATVYPENAANKNITWISSDENVASIDNNGVLTAKEVGIAEITVTTEDGSFTATCQVIVVIPVNEIVLDKENTVLARGQSEKITATVLPEEASDKMITWSSSDENVATVDAEGNITAISVGTAVITAASVNGKTAQCTVEVKHPYYGIHYILNGGINNQYNPGQYCEIDSIVLKAPTRKGYIFGGWYLDAKFTKKVTGIAAGQTGDKTFYAKWTGKTYKIVFNGNTANKGKMSKITYTMGKSTALPANAFVKKEYIFTGWNTKANGKGVAFKNKGSLGAFDAPNGSTITLYAQWKIRQYTITYKLNGGVNNKANPATYNFRSANISLAKPTRRGYSFQGWYTDAACKKAFKGIKRGSTGNRTVYAKWKIVKYTIQYVLNNGTAPKGNPAAYFVTSATIKLKNPTRKGYTFLGWYKEATFKTKVVAIPKGSIGNMKLYAKWTPTKYTIKYNLNGGTNNKKNPALYYVTSAKIILSNPSKRGYIFDGWYTDAKFKNRITTINKGTTGNKTFYAKWKSAKYSISYVLNGGKAPSGNPASYTITSAAITLKNPTRKGYTFAGWYKESGFKTRVTTITKGSVGNYKLYAKWVATKYVITYKLNGGTNNTSNPATYTMATANINLAKPTRKGCVFEGWYSDSKFKNKVTSIPKGSTGNKTLFARWKVYEYIVSYELNGGRFPIGNPPSYNVNTPTITLLDATKKGYDFAGWYKEPTFKTRVTTIPKGSAGNLKLYAKWEVEKSIEQRNLESIRDYIVNNGDDYTKGKEIVFPADSSVTCRLRATEAGKLELISELKVDDISSTYRGSVVATAYDFNKEEWNPVVVSHVIVGTSIEWIIQVCARYNPSDYYPVRPLSYITMSDNTVGIDENIKCEMHKSATETSFQNWDLVFMREFGKSFVDLGFPEFHSH